MPTESRPLARELLRVVLGTPDVPDRDLLARFVASRDEEAFAEIVRRHGPMVLAACRRVTGRPHDAEDAFQAAFLVLARRAGHINRPELLANWLYGVACRTALEARAARRRSEERVVPAAPEPAAPTPPDDTADLRRVIDEELARLPDKYRSAVVLCDLEGLPRAAAAAQLGIPEGTLSSRLAHARKVLAERLTRRGVTAGSAVVAAALNRDAMAVVVPNNLTHKTVHAAVRFVPGAAPPPGVSPAVSSITDGVLKTMLATRLRHLFAIGLLTCGVIGVGVAIAQQLGAPAAPGTPTRGVALDPLAAPDAPPKRAEPKKIAAKGIEDDDVPYGTFPTQAVVRLEEGKLIIRQRVQVMEAVPQKVGEGVTSYSYQRKSSVHASTHDPADVAVFDMKGNRLAQKAWKEQLKNDVHALVATDGKLPNPRELVLFKPDALLIVLPSSTPPAPGGYTAVTDGGRTYYAPIAPAYSAPTAPAARPGVAVPPPAPGPGFISQPLRPAPALPPTTTLPAPIQAPAPAPADPLPGQPTAPEPAPAAPPGEGTAINGTVLKVEGNQIEMSVGFDAGLRAGTKVGMTRDNDRGPSTFLGEVTVTKVEAKRAVGKFTPLRADVALDKLNADELPRPGDTVYFVPRPTEAPGSFADERASD
ncbi:MAG: sigma-70 family RNA polymerase sigma factor [Planctomycetes bacterium]|nr:sigma-70 family RNA polymerase sigma factor [Planctomycetota bacterium]